MKSDEGGQSVSLLSLFLGFEREKQFMKQHDMCLEIINFLMYF